MVIPNYGPYNMDHNAFILEHLGFLVEKLDYGIGCDYRNSANHCDHHCRDMLCAEKEK